MRLTREEENILNGKKGDGQKKAMELLVAIGEINDAERLIPIASAQVSGVSYKTIGEAGIEFLEDWASMGAKVSVTTTLNPMGVDLEQWEEMGYSEAFVKKQKRIIRAYERMGILPSCTCTPYLIGNLPSLGEHIGWAESSSIVFANSVLGARTNRESGISALASAVIGRTPYYGLHLEENRRATFSVEIKTELNNQADYSAMGYYVGKNNEGIPLFKNAKPSLEEMKALGAALGTGSISMFHFGGITPESKNQKAKEKVEFGKQELKEVYEKLNTASKADVVCVGCPHCTIKEILEIDKLHPTKKVWVFTCKQNRELLKNKIKNENIKIISDTCMVVSPLEELGVRSIATNSAKCAFYSRNLSKLGVKFDRLENLLR